MKDKILEMFFDPQRWKTGIEKGVDKNIVKGQLYQLTKPETRLEIYQLMKTGKYKISPPHTAEIPKDNGEMRTVYVNEPIDRVILSIANDLLFELLPERVHKTCVSYQKGIGCGKVVKEVSRNICHTKGRIIGWKSDLSKYFDSVPLKYIDAAFDEVERKWGKSMLIKVLRDYYHCNLYFDTNGDLREKYQSLKQGCAVAAWLADVVLYHIDCRLSSEFGGYYVRYSDDALFVGERYQEAMLCMEHELMQMNMRLNPNKVEMLQPDRWFKFLGYSIKGSMISLSSTRIKKFQHEIESRTIKKKGVTYEKALNSVHRFLYKGNGEYSWATQIIPVCNVRADIVTLSLFVLDCLRAVQTGKKKIGGLGYVNTNPNSCIVRGKGRNVKANRQKTEKDLNGHLSVNCMYGAIHIRKEVYEALVLNL